MPARRSSSCWQGRGRSRGRRVVAAHPAPSHYDCQSPCCCCCVECGASALSATPGILNSTDITATIHQQHPDLIILISNKNIGYKVYRFQTCKEYACKMSGVKENYTEITPRIMYYLYLMEKNAKSLKHGNRRHQTSLPGLPFGKINET